MLPDAYIVHQTPRRLRLRIPSKKGDRAYFAFLQTGLSQYPGVQETVVSPTTASVLLSHDLDLAAFAEHAAIDGFFRMRKTSLPAKPLHAKALEPLAYLDGCMKDLTGGQVDMASLVFLGLAGFGIYQISIGNFTAPAWYTAFWYAMNTALKAGAGGGNDECGNDE